MSRNIINPFRINILHMIGGQLTVAAAQGLQFLFLARALGPKEFGLLAATLAISAILLPFAGVGAANIMIMRYAQNKSDINVYYGNAQLVALVTGIFLSLVGISAGTYFLDGLASSKLLIYICLSEIILTKFVDVTAHVYYAQERHKYAGLIYSSHSLIRLLFSIIFIYSDSEKSAVSWASWHFSSGVLSVLFSFSLTKKQIGKMKFSIKLAVKELKNGLFFSIGLSAKSLYTDVDKAALARLASADTAGAYTAAFRIVYMAATPLKAILLAASAKFFREGKAGISAPVKFANKIAILGTIYAIFLAAIMWNIAPLLLLALGDKYNLSVEILRWLSLLPMLQIIQEAYSDALMGAGFQKARSIFQSIAAVICVILNYLLITKYSWHGAVWATYITQLFLAIVILILTWFIYKKTNRLNNLKKENFS